MRVAVGSRNPAKVEPVREALAHMAPEAEVVAVAVSSGVAANPIGEEETLRGAERRAREALQQAAADVGVGLEGGVAFGPEGPCLVGWAVALARDGRSGRSRTTTIALPEAVARRVREGTELGDVIDELTGRRGSKLAEGAVGHFTRGAVRRGDLWRQAAACALAPVLFPEAYRKEELLV